ncbi:ROK family glucokinase [Oceanobacillus profundus]|uniref:Glucokinase n=1 Tax=Oceanobacillus profundus TaxID=372463 RepID=A0A417YJN0_9BACI|nr:ROK family glucokinase [Oceanobacillus profundus]PAE31212.1 glucokinase [Paenibacillus sp. 7884-2]RHW33190.1 ROK family protein [Oceanobacillus profundus]
MEKLLLGIDIGGTSVKIGIINQQGEILEKWEVPTNKLNAGITIVDEIWASIERKLSILHLSISSFLGVGVGAPGFIDMDSGIVSEAVNIGWKDFPLADQLKEKSSLPVFVANDANIAVLGENWTGAGNQAKNLVALTLGTGVGGGIIVNGSILNGINGMAGELGHLTIEKDGYACNCGNNGCLETIASATGIVRQAMDKIASYPDSKPAEIYKKYQAITAKDIFDLAKDGDAIAISIVKRTADVLGQVIANLGVIINPSKVLIGGGVSKAGDLLVNEIRIAFRKYALPRVSDACEIKIAQLGNDAGIIGGASLVLEKLNNDNS